MATAVQRAWAVYREIPQELTAEAIEEANETEFDREVRRLRLGPYDLVNSVALRFWAKRYCHKRYVPEWLLETWGIVVDFDWAQS